MANCGENASEKGEARAHEQTGETKCETIEKTDLWELCPGDLTYI